MRVGAKPWAASEGRQVVGQLKQVFGPLALRQHDPVGRRGHDRGKVLKRLSGPQCVDPHEQLLPLSRRPQHRRHCKPGRLFGAGCNGILQVEDQRIGVTGTGLVRTSAGCRPERRENYASCRPSTGRFHVAPKGEGICSCGGENNIRLDTMSSFSDGSGCCGTCLPAPGSPNADGAAALSRQGQCRLLPPTAPAAPSRSPAPGRRRSLRRGSPAGRGSHPRAISPSVVPGTATPFSTNRIIPTGGVTRPISNQQHQHDPRTTADPSRRPVPAAPQPAGSSASSRSAR